MEAIVAAAKPKMSVESLVGKIEDAGELTVSNPFTDEVEPGVKPILFINQAPGVIELFSLVELGDSAGVTAAVLALGDDVQFVQVLTPAGATQFGE